MTVPLLRFGTNICITSQADGNMLIYVANAEPMVVRLPRWLSVAEKDVILNAAKDAYLSAVRRVLSEQILEESPS